ncbi:MAG: family 10 glycosylhydrolase [Limnochordales bacterium]
MRVCFRPLAWWTLAALALCLALAGPRGPFAPGRPLAEAAEALPAPEAIGAAAAEGHGADGAEVRAVWVSNAILGRLGGPAGVLELLDQLARANVNVVLPEAVFRGYTLYPGPYQDPRFAAWPVDPLDFIAREAGARGLEVHPWVWVFAAGLDPAPGPILRAHPEWAECRPDLPAPEVPPGPLPAAGRTLWLTPAEPAARQFLIEEFLGILRRYPVHGLHLDYIRYSEAPCGDGWPRASAARYQAETGRDPSILLVSGGEGGGAGALRDEAVAWHLWREAQVNAFVRDLARRMRAENPQWLLSAAVTPEIREARFLRLQDWQHWLANGWVDYVFPMAYTSHIGLLRTMMASWEELGPQRERLVPGLLVPASPLPDLLAQLAAVRAEPVAGVALFAADHLPASHWRALESGPFAVPAPVPFRDAGGAVRRWPAPAALVPPTDPPVFVPAPEHDGGANLARQAQVRVDSSFRGYGPHPLNDGRRNDEVEIGRWAEVAWASAETPEPHWIELEWSQPQRIARVDLYWARDRDQFHASRRYRVEAWTGDGWQLIFAHESPVGTTHVTRHSVSFVPVTTTRLRIWQPPGGGPAGRPDLMWVAEVEAYGE